MTALAMFRGLMRAGARWTAVLVLTAAFFLLGVMSSQADAATAPLSVSGIGTTSPVLRQAGSTWETTVLVNDVAPGCTDAGSARYWLATTPYGLLSTAGAQSPVGTVASTVPDGSACEVTVTFKNLAKVPTAAALVVNQSGASTSIMLTVSRDVTLFSYLGIPAIAGGIAVALYLLCLLFVTSYDWEDVKHHPIGRRLVDTAWWKHPIAGSGAWTAGDSWATNISTGLVVVSTVLAAATASSTLFPGVALDRFAIVNILAGVFVVAAPVLFGILYAHFTGRAPGASADSMMQVPPGRHVLLRVPSGATVTMIAQTTISRTPAGPANVVKAGDSYLVAPGSVIAIWPPAQPGGAAAPAVDTIAFSGTSDIGLLPGATVRTGPEPATPQSARDPVVARALPVRFTATGGAKITVTGTADVNLPEQAVITGPRQKRGRVKRPGRWFLIPQGNTVIVGSLGIMVAANILTMFGIGAELGTAFVLARFSEGTGPAIGAVYAGLGVLGVFMLWYAFSATQAMANPQPGSALSAQAGTSFTL